MRTYQAGEEICPKCGYRHHRETWSEFALRPGTVLHNGRYIVGKVLGNGSYGITYIGLDTALALRVAVKEYHPTTNDRNNLQAGRASFVIEARKLAEMDLIPGIIPVRDVFYENNTAYIIESLIEGYTLADLIIKQGQMDIDTCIDTLHPVMKTLERIHACNIIHCDVSPVNIMIDKAGEKWLLDFGEARTTGEKGEPVVSITGGPIRAPEIFSGQDPVGPWTDIYSLCVVIGLCVGSPRMVEDIPKIGAVLKKGMAKGIQDRYQSVMEFSDALKKALKSGESTTSNDIMERASGNSQSACDYEAWDEVFALQDYYKSDFLAGPLQYELYEHYFSSEEWGYYVVLGAVEIGSVSEFNPFLTSDGFSMRFGNNIFHSPFNFMEQVVNRSKKNPIYKLTRSVFTSSGLPVAKLTFKNTSCDLLVDGKHIRASREGDNWHFYKGKIRVATYMRFKGDVSLPGNRRGYDRKESDFFVFGSLTSLETMILLGFRCLCLSKQCKDEASIFYT